MENSSVDGTFVPPKVVCGYEEVSFRVTSFPGYHIQEVPSHVAWIIFPALSYCGFLFSPPLVLAYPGTASAVKYSGYFVFQEVSSCPLDSANKSASL